MNDVLFPKELLRGKLRFFILKALSEKPMHGYEVRRKIEEFYFGAWKPSFGTLYPALKKLQEDGLIETAGEGTRGMKIYRITQKGKEHLKNAKKSIENANKAVVAFYREAIAAGFELEELAEAFAFFRKIVKGRLRKYRGTLLRFLLFANEGKAKRKHLNEFISALEKFLKSVDKINSELEN